MIKLKYIMISLLAVGIAAGCSEQRTGSNASADKNVEELIEQADSNSDSLLYEDKADTVENSGESESTE